MHTKSLLIQNLINYLWEFRYIDSFCAFGTKMNLLDELNKMNLLDFEVKSQVSAEFMDTFLWNITLAHHQAHRTMMIFSRSWVQMSRLQATYSENVVLQWRHIDWWFAIKDHLVWHLCILNEWSYFNKWITISTDIYNC